MSQTLADYTILVQNEVEDTSSRAKNIIERAIKDTYNELMLFLGKFLIENTEEDVTATINQRYVETVAVFDTFDSILWKNADSDSYYPLERMSEEDYYKHYVNRDAGDPTKYYMNADKIYFDIAPSNAGTVKVSGKAIHNELTGTTVSLIPLRHTQLVVKGSVANFKAYEGLQDAREYFKLYRGPYFEQGSIGGELKMVLDQYNSRQQQRKLKLFGK